MGRDYLIMLEACTEFTAMHFYPYLVGLFVRTYRSPGDTPPVGTPRTAGRADGGVRDTVTPYHT